MLAPVYDEIEGNNVERRSLTFGRPFEIVKNFPTRKEIMTILGDIADNVKYIELPDEKIGI